MPAASRTRARGCRGRRRAAASSRTVAGDLLLLRRPSPGRFLRRCAPRLRRRSRRAAAPPPEPRRPRPQPPPPRRRGRTASSTSFSGATTATSVCSAGRRTVTPSGELQVLRRDVLAELEVRDIDLELHRDAVRQAAHRDGAVDDAEDAALGDAGGLAEARRAGPRRRPAGRASPRRSRRARAMRLTGW